MDTTALYSRNETTASPSSAPAASTVTTLPAHGRTDWARLDALTEDERRARALADPDALPFTADEWARAVVNVGGKRQSRATHRAQAAAVPDESAAPLVVPIPADIAPVTAEP